MKQNATLDSSFWVNAHSAGLLRHVLDRFTVHYPPAVAAEMSPNYPSGREFWRLAREGVLIEAVPEADAVKMFGSGERAAINLALEHPGWVLLMDDRRPLLEAQRMGVKTLCTPVLVVDLFKNGLCPLPDALRLLARLAALQTVSPALLRLGLAELELLRLRKEERHGDEETNHFGEA